MLNFLPIALFVITGLMLVLRILIWRQLGHGGRILFFLVYFGVIALGVGVPFIYAYVRVEFVNNKGPDDWNASLHVGNALGPKYGYAPKLKYQLQSFATDSDGSGSGTYHYRFKSAGTSGVMLCHYNKAAHQFDHDEIMPDK